MHNRVIHGLFFQSYLQDHGSGNFSTLVTLQRDVTTSLYILKYLWLHSLLGLSPAHLDFEAVVKNTQLPQDPTFCEIQSACQENGFVTVLFRGNCHVIYWSQRWEPQGMMLQRLSLEEPLWLAARTTGSVSSCCDQYSRPFLCQGGGCQILEELRPSAHQGQYFSRQLSLGSLSFAGKVPLCAVLCCPQCLYFVALWYASSRWTTQHHDQFLLFHSHRKSPGLDTRPRHLLRHGKLVPTKRTVVMIWNRLFLRSATWFQLLPDSFSFLFCLQKLGLLHL